MNNNLDFFLEKPYTDANEDIMDHNIFEGACFNSGTICYEEGEQIINYFSTGADTINDQIEYNEKVIEDQFCPQVYDIENINSNIDHSQTENQNEEYHNIFDDESEDNRCKTKGKSEASERKMAEDSIRKKVKVRICEAMVKMANKQIVKQFPTKLKLKFRKLPQNFIKNINISENKLSLNWTMEELFCNNYGDPMSKKYLNNLDVLKKLREVGDKNNLKFLSLSLKDTINLYLNSKMFEEDLQKIKETENAEYHKKFHQIAKGIPGKRYSYIEYFEKIVPNKIPLRFPKNI